MPLFSDATVVSTGVPGLRDRQRFAYRDGRTTPARAVDLRFIDLNGASATQVRLDRIGFVPNGAEVAPL